MTSSVYLLLIGALCATCHFGQADRERREELTPAEQLQQLLLRYRKYREENLPGLSASRWGREVISARRSRDLSDEERLEAMLKEALDRYQALKDRYSVGTDTGRWGRSAEEDKARQESLLRAALDRYLALRQKYKNGEDSGRWGLK